MKYNSKENVHQVLTALTVKRLQAYAGLCKCYSELADIMVNEEGRAQVTASDIEQRYASILSTVAYHDIADFDIIAKKGNFSEKEVDIFKRFSNISKNFIDFTNGYNILRNSVSKNSPDIDQEVISDYRDFMTNKAQNSRTQNFIDYIDSHTPVVIGKNFYSMYTRSIHRIQEIDDTHVNIPQFSDSKELPRRIFGGQGALRLSKNPQYGMTQRESSPEMVDYLDEDAENLYSKRETRTFKRKISPKEKISDMAYYTGAKVNGAIKESKLPLKKLAILAAAGLLVGANVTSCIHKNVSQLPATQAYADGLDLDISDETARDLVVLGQEIENASHSPNIPTTDDLWALLNHLDHTNSCVAQDLAETAFRRKHPEYSDVNATTTFEYVNSADPRKDEITFSYLDENGEKQVQVISNHDYDYGKSFDRENEYVSVMPNKIKELSDESIPFEQRTRLVKEFLQMCRDRYNDLDEFAGMEPEIRSGLLGQSVAANTIDRSNESTNQDKNSSQNVQKGDEGLDK